MLVMTNICHDKHTFVVTKDAFCRDKHGFVMTKPLLRQNMILVAAPAYDRSAGQPFGKRQVFVMDSE